MLERKRKTLQKKRKRRVKLRTLLLLSMTLIFNTYAWFLYATTVSTTMTVHVNAWSVDFKIGDTQIEKIFTIDIPNAYPGMPDVAKVITVNNSGEKVAELKFELKAIRILDTTYTISQTHSDEPNTFTSAEMLTKLANDYPFKITVIADNTNLAIGASGSITIRFEWDYESDDDTTDTYYGTEAYKYYQTNTGTPAIQLLLDLTAIQINSP